MSVADGDIIRIVMNCSFAGNDIQNVYYGKVSGDQNSNTVILQYVGNWLDAIYGELDEFTDPVVHFDNFTVYNVTSDSMIGTDTLPYVSIGTSEDESLPRQTAPVVRFPTSQLRCQGRKFFPCTVDSSASTNGIVGTALLSALADAAAIILGGIDGLGWDVAIGAFNPDLARFSPFISYVVNGFFGTQRRRQAGVGS